MALALLRVFTVRNVNTRSKARANHAQCMRMTVTHRRDCTEIRLCCAYSRGSCPVYEHDCLSLRDCNDPQCVVSAAEGKGNRDIVFACTSQGQAGDRVSDWSRFWVPTFLNGLLYGVHTFKRGRPCRHGHLLHRIFTDTTNRKIKVLDRCFSAGVFLPFFPFLTTGTRRCRCVIRQVPQGGLHGLCRRL